MNPLASIGRTVIAFFATIGRISLFSINAASHCFQPPFYGRILGRQLVEIGYYSLPVVGLTAIFTGMVLALQSYTGFTRFNAEDAIASVVALSITRELAPVLAGLMVAGRIGAAMAAEIGTMKVTEQIDALESISLDPIAYLVFPRVFAGIIMFPVLIIIADIFGISGGVFAAATSLDIDTYQFMKGFKTWFKPWDAWYGVIKGLSFGIAITTISCFYGFYTKGGAAGVGKSTTSSVVVSCVAIMLLDYILAALLL